MAQIRFFDLELNIPGQIWSPNTCKTRFALNIKNIPYETEWVNFSNLYTIIPAITKTGKKPTVPIIVDLSHHNQVIQDSWDIALYLEENFPDTPSLFHGNVGLHKFFYDYCTFNILPILFKLIVLSIDCGPSQAWFRKNNEAKFGTTLEVYAGDSNKNMEALKLALVPIYHVLKKYPFITGDKVGWADVVLAAHFTMLQELRPDLFKLVFAHPLLSTWWNLMYKYRTGNTLARL